MLWPRVNGAVDKVEFVACEVETDTDVFCLLGVKGLQVVLVIDFDR